MNDNLEFSLVDYIIKKWFPVLGVLFIVGGISYLFYDGIWQNIGESARLMVGFIFGILFIAGGYTFENKLRGFGDVVIGGGLLIMYVTLIFGSRLSAVEFAYIPEVLALIIAFLFSVAIAFYAYERKSKYILALGALGGYLTPYFMGGSVVSHLATNNEISLPIFLIYFASISLAIFFAANKMFLKGVGLLNALGLFLGTFALVVVKGAEFRENILFLVVFSIVVVIFHVAAMAVNAKKFEKESDPFLVGGYLLPLLWFTLFVLTFIASEITNFNLSAMFGSVALFYFGAWYYLRNTTESDKHFSLYVGGLIATIIGLSKLMPLVVEYSGLMLSLLSIIFIWLFFKKPLVQREFSALIFALGGVLFNLFQVGNISFSGIGPVSGISVYIILTLIPLMLLSPTVKIIKHIGEAEAFRRFLGYIAFLWASIILLSDLIDFSEIPFSFIIFVIPAIILLIIGVQEKDYLNKNKYFNWSVSLAMIGFIGTFFTIIDRFYPAPENLYPLSTPESLIGLSVLGILFVVIKKYVEFDAGKNGYVGTPFLIVFSFYLTLWSVVTHEVLGVFNLFGFDFSNPAFQGVRAFFITLLWAGLALYMLFTAEKKNQRNKKNIGFALLATTILKLVFYDLANVNTNLKVFLFIAIGTAIMYVSYNANKNEEENKKEIK